MIDKVLYDKNSGTIYYDTTPDLVKFCMENNISLALVNKGIDTQNYEPTENEISEGKKALMRKSYELLVDPIYFNMLKGKATKSQYLGAINQIRRSFNKPDIAESNLNLGGGLNTISNNITYEVGADKRFTTLQEGIRYLETIKLSNASAVTFLVAEGLDIGGLYNFKNIDVPIHITSNNKWVNVSAQTKGNIIIANAKNAVWLQNIKIRNLMQKQSNGAGFNWYKNDIAQTQNRTGINFKNCLEANIHNIETEYIEINYTTSRGFLYGSVTNRLSPYCGINILAGSNVVAECCNISIEKCAHYFMGIFYNSRFYANNGRLRCDKNSFVSETNFGKDSTHKYNGIYVAYLSSYNTSNTTTISNTGHNGICVTHSSKMGYATLNINERSTATGEAFINVREASEISQYWNTQTTLRGFKTYQVVAIQASKLYFWANKWSNQTGRGNAVNTNGAIIAK